jgi:8-amino-7-oxononanoate synthase
MVTVDGQSLLSFCSNDYLGLANDARVRAVFQQAAEQYGVGSGASHLITGHMRPHHALEEELAAWVGAERALLFSTGYMANLGVVSALTGRGDHLFEDKLNHASLIDAARLSGAEVHRYRHGDIARLAEMLAATSGEKLILTDGVFSMDGDEAGVSELAELSRKHGAWLLVDDAHGLGVHGPQGAGTLARHGLKPRAPIILMGTLGKALGTFGAFVAGNAEMIEMLIQRARSYIYTTALPPAVAEATRASVRIAREEEGRRDTLRRYITTLRAGAARLGLNMPDSATPIQPLILGDDRAALAASAALREQGILVPAIRPPTVPEGQSRLRVSLSAAHTDADIGRLLAALAKIA